MRFSLFAPFLIGNRDTYGFAWDVQIVGRYAYVADGGSGLQIIDITDPKNPTLKGNSKGFAFDVQIVGKYAYVAGLSGLGIIDISNPITLTPKGGYYTHSMWASRGYK